MLRYNADIKTIAYMIVTTAVLFIQWNLGALNPFLYVFSLFMAISVAVIAHNHNHLPIWRNKTMNSLTDYWLTLFYGFPAFGWIPTHNLNHHKLNNREGDYTITYRVSEQNALWTLIIYPSISSYFQQKPIRDYLKKMRATDKKKFYLAAGQYVALVAMYIVAFVIDWQKALLYIVIPHQVSLYSVMIFNYVQHVHADEESKYNHSRNFTGFLNKMLFNNGYHTIHHERAGIHWSLLPEAHAKEIAPHIDPVLNERSFWGYIVRVYILGLFSERFRTHSKRLERMGAIPAPKQPEAPQRASVLS